MKHLQTGRNGVGWPWQALNQVTATHAVHQSLMKAGPLHAEIVCVCRVCVLYFTSVRVSSPGVTHKPFLGNK